LIYGGIFGVSQFRNQKNRQLHAADKFV